MALFLALALSLLIVETDVPSRKPPTNSATDTTTPGKARKAPPPRRNAKALAVPKARKARKARRKASAAEALLKTLHPHAAGIDVGAEELWLCLPPGDETAQEPADPTALPPYVRRFGTFTADLQALAALLRQEGVTTVALESTGVYWIALYDLLQKEGLQVLLVDPHQTRCVPGRPKTDVKDCMWIRRLHSLGLLSAAFRPDEPIRILRSYQRHRQSLIEDASRFILRMQKALEQMNVKLTEVLSDITGVTGMAILRAIVAGERDRHKLAKLRDYRCKEEEKTIALALEGTWQVEHLFALKQSLEIYDYFQQQIAQCDQEIDRHLQTLALPARPEPLAPRPRSRKRVGNELRFDARERLYQITGTDLTAIEGIEANTALVILSEIGTDMGRWPNEKAFGAWLGLAPNPNKSGGKLKSAASRPGKNRAAKALRLAARNLRRSNSALGAFFRRIASRRGVPKAITATAYKLARIVYAMLKHGMPYAQKGLEEYEADYRQRQVRLLKKKANELGFALLEKPVEQPV
jgi:transposase